jgi:hypothetical protein
MEEMPPEQAEQDAPQAPPQPAEQAPGAPPVYTAENLPPRQAFSEFAKQGTTPALRIEGPFTVETSEGPLTCSDGWLAIDSAGNPYPIDAGVFAETYKLAEPAEETDHLEVLRSRQNGAVALLLVRHSGEQAENELAVQQLEAVAQPLGFTITDRRNAV